MSVKFIEIKNHDEKGGTSWNLIRADEIKRILMFGTQIRYFTTKDVIIREFVEEFENEVDCRQKYNAVKWELCDRT